MDPGCASFLLLQWGAQDEIPKYALVHYVIRNFILQKHMQTKKTIQIHKMHPGSASFPLAQWGTQEETTK